MDDTKDKDLQVKALGRKHVADKLAEYEERVREVNAGVVRESKWNYQLFVTFDKDDRSLYDAINLYRRYSGKTWRTFILHAIANYVVADNLDLAEAIIDNIVNRRKRGRPTRYPDPPNSQSGSEKTTATDQATDVPPPISQDQPETQSPSQPPQG